MLNETTIIGNLGNDAIVRPNNDQFVISFSVATSEKWKDGKTGERKERTTWFNCSYWVRSTEVTQYLKKGNPVYVRGKVSTRTYQSENGETNASLDLRVVELKLLPNGQNKETAQTATPVAPNVPESIPTGVPQPGDDDLPF